LEGANVDYLLAACVGDALVCKRYDPEKNESDPHKRYRIIDAHKIPFKSRHGYPSRRP
jgi:hypothetical protein